MSDLIPTSFLRASTVASNCSFIILVRRTLSGNDTAPIPSLVKKLSGVLVRQNHLPFVRSNASIPATGTLRDEGYYISVKSPFYRLSESCHHLAILPNMWLQITSRYATSHKLHFFRIENSWLLRIGRHMHEV